MNIVLTQAIVLSLNKGWQAINVKTPQEAFPMMATGVATGLDIDGDVMRPVPWEEWLKLPVREQDRSVMTTHGPVRIPSVIVLANYAKVPKKRPKLCSKSIRERDGNRCQYTGRLLRPEDGSVDHVQPRSRGGRNEWDNLVWASKEVNAKKANRTPIEAGLPVPRPRKPLEVPITNTLRNSHNIPDWNLFLK